MAIKRIPPGQAMKESLHRFLGMRVTRLSPNNHLIRAFSALAELYLLSRDINLMLLKKTTQCL